MFTSSPASEFQDIKAIIFMYKSTAQMKDEYIRKEQFELAAEAQLQLKALKQSLFEILLADRFTVEQKEDGSINIRTMR